MITIHDCNAPFFEKHPEFAKKNYAIQQWGNSQIAEYKHLLEVDKHDGHIYTTPVYTALKRVFIAPLLDENGFIKAENYDTEFTVDLFGQIVKYKVVNNKIEAR